ncbi:bifunctional phosphoribosylaminoimidazolecarboxamide formyltransferase/IMP cyclohydrolase PurH [Paracoccus suum]|uniref:Bifunctional purine biosynthesis protein PurH n=1 Tax=Paracoccus suum TaxID=2259340 RepID=A0A344PIF9_9RHOB|nr:bifunctional phosphoribosylaminoimidazolecarboxamide formyltransferase/IMP cyclohydrolase [Paracoccus suum]AXC49164.1 bifunctional phosphoribosylaminoimidazolecarboxamide formyltransferase/IMP cyclohydrolase PurH [Paracoccus suum]
MTASSDAALAGAATVDPGASRLPVRRALISVSDKTGLAELGRALTDQGVQILSTGGTAQALRAAGVAVTEVADVTGYPEMMDGRVRTLHPAVHGGLLALRDNPGHVADMQAYGIEGIDLLVSNLYPFEAVLEKGASIDDCIENIDIGGPAMTRAAAKNHAHVAVVVDLEDYAPLLAQIAEGGTTAAFRRQLAQIAFARTAAYDTAVSTWLAGVTGGDQPPRRRAFAGTLAQPLRYGENPHQTAAFYRSAHARTGVATARQWQGKELSYNNINDTDAAYELVADFAAADGPACAIIKHANPCGVARGATPAEAYARAFDCDRTSAFGGIVALNRPLDGPTAEEIVQIFTEVVIAPDADEAARAVFARKPNLRLLTAGGLPDPTAAGDVLRQVAGGYLVQSRDAGRISRDDLRIVTQVQPTAAQLDDLLFAWTVAKHVKSNAIVYARDLATVGIGAGQMSRIDSTRIGRRKAEDMAAALGLDAPLTEGAVVASDAFFPFADGVEALAEAGAVAVIQPGGSMRDAEVIAAADRLGLAMVFTGQRHFRH